MTLKRNKPESSSFMALPVELDLYPSMEKSASHQAGEKSPTQTGGIKKVKLSMAAAKGQSSSIPSLTSSSSTYYSESDAGSIGSYMSDHHRVGVPVGSSPPPMFPTPVMTSEKEIPIDTPLLTARGYSTVSSPVSAKSPAAPLVEYSASTRNELNFRDVDIDELVSPSSLFASKATDSESLPKAAVNKLEETDAHKDGTEKTARQYIRKAFLNSRLNEYTISLLLGWGGNGAVVGGIRKRDKTPVAIKLIYKRKPEQKVCPTPVNDLPNEILVLQKMKQKNIVKCIEWFEDLDSFYLVTNRVESNWTESTCSHDELHADDECMTVTKDCGGKLRLAIRSGASDLFSFIDLNISVPESQRKDIFKGIAKALGYMHNLHSVTHGDIKEENILLSSDFQPKLCDFGHARPRVKTATGFEKRVAFYGTRDMTAPELIPNLHNKSTGYALDRYSGFEADIWALGLLLYSMCAGTLGNDHQNFIDRVAEKSYRRDTYPINSSYVEDRDCLDLLRGMLRIDPKMRMSIRDVLRHPFCR